VSVIRVPWRVTSLGPESRSRFGLGTRMTDCFSRGGQSATRASGSARVTECPSRGGRREPGGTPRTTTRRALRRRCPLTRPPRSSRAVEHQRSARARHGSWRVCPASGVPAARRSARRIFLWTLLGMERWEISMLRAALTRQRRRSWGVVCTTSRPALDDAATCASATTSLDVLLPSPHNRVI
jgi:hypothetical protein